MSRRRSVLSLPDPTARRALEALAIACLLTAVPAQRGGGFRGPPQEVTQRWGNYFSTMKITEEAQVQDLAQTDHVKNAVTAGHLALVYLYDSSANAKKLQAFEEALFGNAKLQPGLRLYVCGRLDLAGSAAAQTRYGKIAPAFFVYDMKGKEVGQASMSDLKADPNGLLRLLKGGTKGYSKVSFDNFIKTYSKWLRDLTNLEGRKRTLEQKRERIDEPDKPANQKKLKKIDDDVAKLEKERETLMAQEVELLERAKVPPRKDDAAVVGQRQFGRR